MAIGLMAAISSCETTVIPGAPDYSNYFGLEEGQFREYLVDSIYYRETVDNDTTQWEVREEIGESFTDLEGQLAYTVLRYKRLPGNSNWIYEHTWTARVNSQHAELVENNLRFLKLAFPPSSGKTWAGHIHLGGLSTIPVTESCNNLSFLEGWDFVYEQVHQPLFIGPLDFDSTVTVLQTGNQNLIEFNESREVYAMGVGLIQRDFFHLTTQDICESCPWDEKAECGYAVSTRITAHN